MEWLKARPCTFKEMKALSQDSERRYFLEKMLEKQSKPISKTQLNKLNNSEKRKATAYNPYKPIIAYKPKKEMDWLEYEKKNNNPLN